MFPQGFFFDATMVIALSTIAEAVLLVLGPIYLMRRRARSFDTAPKMPRTKAEIGDSHPEPGTLYPKP